MRIFCHIMACFFTLIASIPAWAGESALTMDSDSAGKNESAVVSSKALSTSLPKGVVFQDGEDFFSYKKPIILTPKAGDNRIEISLFFTYECLYCSTAYDNLILYQRLHDEQIELNFYPAAISDAPFSANVFNGLIAMGRRDLAELLIFDSAVNKGKNSLVDAKNLYPWLIDHDVSPDAFLSTLRSDLIINQTKQDIERTERYGIFTVPLVVINGEYALTRSTLYNDDYTFAVLDYLISHILDRKTEQE